MSDNPDVSRIEHPALRSMGVAINKTIARDRTLSRAYLIATGALLRLLPDFSLKENIINNLTSAAWPEVPLPAQDVSLIPGQTQKMVPYVCDPYFRILFSSNLDHEPEVFNLLARRMHLYDGVVEIGAHVGLYTIFFGQSFRSIGKRSAKVLAFEPSPEAFRRLETNVDLNDLDNIAIRNCAVSSTNGQVTLHQPRGHLSNCSLSREFSEIFTKDVEMVSVASVSGKRAVRQFDAGLRLLIKLDAEGSEGDVLDSFGDWLATNQPDIVVEVLEETENALNSLGILRDCYRFYNITGDGLLRFDEFKATSFRDYLLIPTKHL